MFGRVLALDDIIQITEKDHHAYTEMLVHFPIIANKSIRKVLIIGGGDGAIASEILKTQSITKKPTSRNPLGGRKLLFFSDSREKAEEYLTILSDKEMNILKKRMNKGGVR